ncbi:DUF3237 domain-containing protein [Aquirufa sp. OSTEICH-129V]|uniref:UPF0311 protein U0R10_11025 n=1 Tax=Aquirufa avitistagni TaxID=3104728 RepID=A0ABW6DE22_9BACT
MQTPELIPVFEATIQLGEVQTVGDTRRIVQVVGGQFSGPNFQAKVLAGGGDWQVIHADGRVEIDTRYTLETPEGSLIYLQNKGMRLGTYMRTVATFEVQDARNSWLTESIYIATGKKEGDVVSHEFYRLS